MRPHGTGTPIRDQTPNRMFLVLMGVAGSGKTTLGQALGRRLGWEFRDADGFHPPANIAKMSAGTPLQDEDRWPWLQAIRAHMESEHAAGRSGIIACSALKASYRKVLGQGQPWVRFVHLSGSRDLIEGRMRAREGHFMPVSLLDSQFATLESPDDAITLDIDRPPEALADEVLRRIA